MKITHTTDLKEVKLIFPEIAYKYRDWSNDRHKTILTRQEVFFAPTSSFWTEDGDPYDCRYPVEFDFSFEIHRPAYETFFKHDPTVVRPDQYEAVLREYHRVNLGTDQGRKRFEENYYEITNLFLGVLSVTLRNDNLKIWRSNYAVDFSGFCVGIDFSDCVEELYANYIGGGTINYVKSGAAPLQFASIHTHGFEKTISEYMKLIHTKYERFSFEEEYRLIKHFYNREETSPITIADRLFTVPKRCFKSIAFGYKMPETARQEIVQICANQGLSVDFFVAWPPVGNSEKVLLAPYS